MPLSGNPFSGLPAATLTDLKAKFLQCLVDIATSGQTYTLNGRSYGGADMAEVKETIRQLQEAQDYQGGTVRTHAFPVFNNFR